MFLIVLMHGINWYQCAWYQYAITVAISYQNNIKNLQRTSKLTILLISMVGIK